MKRNILLLLMALQFAVTLMAQDIRVSGTVVDKSTHEKMKSVSVTIPNTNISTVTNDDGYFLLKLNSWPKEISIASYGYKTQTVRIDSESNPELHISLQPASINLPELYVWQNDPEALINNAMTLIRENFVQTRELHTSFYRETLQKGSRYIDISEAILSTCKKGYDKGINADQVKVEHGRHIVSQNMKDTLSVHVLGGPRTAINYDAVKNSEILFDDIREHCYYFNMELPEELDGRTQIVISFYPRLIKDWALFSGKIYLDRQTLAFTRIEMSLDVSDKTKATRMLLIRKPASLRFKPLQLTTIINYRNGRINYMKTYMRFKCDWKKRLFSRSYACCSEMVVTDFTRNYEGPNIESGERFRERDELSSTINEHYEPDFWKDYNIIEPTENLEKAIKKLKKR